MQIISTSSWQCHDFISHHCYNHSLHLPAHSAFLVPLHQHSDQNLLQNIHLKNIVVNLYQ